MDQLVALPGLDGTGLLLQDFAKASAGSNCRIIQYPADQELDYAQLAEFVRPLLPSDEPFFLLAESFSGPVAALLAAGELRNLKGVIFVCTFLTNPRPELAAAKPLISMMPIRNLPVSFISIPTLGNWSNDDLRERIRESLAMTRNSVQRARLRNIIDVDVTDAARKISVPVLYLQATHDFLVSPASANKILECIPHACLREVEGPHFLLQVKPQECGAIIHDFMRSVVTGNE